VVLLLFQRFSTSADHYLYLPMFGLAICLAALMRRMRQRIGACIVLIVWAALTIIQTGVWQNDRTLFLHALSVNPKSFMAQSNLFADALREGNFDEEEITEEQLNGAALAFAWAAEQYDIPPDRLAGHKDASGDTSCPGASLYARIPELKDRVGALLATPPVNLQKICGPDADAIVADIEAGIR